MVDRATVIERGNDLNVRKQITGNLKIIGNWAMVKNSVEAGEDVTIPLGYQMIVWDSFAADGGTLTVEGDLIVL